jgi:hypothetical protein
MAAEKIYISGIVVKQGYLTPSVVGSIDVNKKSYVTETESGCKRKKVKLMKIFR